MWCMCLGNDTFNAIAVLCSGSRTVVFDEYHLH